MKLLSNSALVLALSAMINLSANAQWSGWQPADSRLSTNVSVCVPEGSTHFIFAKGLDSKVYFDDYRDVIPNGWTGPQPLADFTTNFAPDAIAPLPINGSPVYVFATGADGLIRYTTGNYDMGNETATWSKGWAKIDGLQSNVSPSVTFPGTLTTLAVNNIYLVAKGSQDNNVHINVYNGLDWKGWFTPSPDLEASKFQTSSAIESCFDFDDDHLMTIYMFARTMENKIQYNTFSYNKKKTVAGPGKYTCDNGNWGDWRDITAPFTTLNSMAASIAVHKISLFAVGSDKKIYYSTAIIPTDKLVHRTGLTWTPWIEVPGGFQTDAPVAVSNRPELISASPITLFAKGLDGIVYKNVLAQ